MYGRDGDIRLKLENEGPPVTIRSIDAVFPPDGSLTPYVAHLDVNERLDTRASDSYQIPVHADLRLPTGTQTFKFHIRVELNGTEHTIVIDPVNHFDFRPRPGDSLVFISHKIPEETPLAQSLARFLARAGFECFLAEDDKRPGIPLHEKIFPNIDSCFLFVALWTKRASESTYIKREIRHAQRGGKFCYLAIERGLPMPPGAPRSVEFDPFDSTLDEEAMARIAERIMRNDMAGHYRHIA